MDINNPQRMVFLKKIHLFHGLEDDQIGTIASALEVETFLAGKDILKGEDKGHRFYLIYDGDVGVTKKNKQTKQDEISTLVTGDYFAEEALLGDNSQPAVVIAREDTTTLSLTREKYRELIKQIPILKINFEVTIASQHLAAQKQFNWLEPEEVIYFLARKHQVLLWQALTTPVISMVIPVALLVLVSLGQAAISPVVSKVAIITAMVVFLIIVGVIIWRWIDWGNDYYIVTSQRVIWLEKVVGIYDSRQEAPLSTVLSVGVQTDQFGRWMDYGDVIIRTFVGKIIFHHVGHPHQAGAIVEEYWSRAKARTRKSDMDAMQQTIRQKLGLPAEQVVTAENANALITQSPYKPSALAMAFSNIFKLRYEVGSIITYRKHWIVLVENVWQPTALFITGLAVVIWRAIDWIMHPASTLVDRPIIAIVGVVLIPIFLWWLYQYIDWRNDIYQVTEDQILDINKTPLGREERKAAPLDNILTTASQRIGILQVMWNYGDVLITVGGAQLVFEDVMDPSSVQQDLDRRRLAQQVRKKQTEAAAERERVADWFVTYHRSVDEMRKEREGQQPSEENGNEENKVK
jgi:CRP-like cAMP-binding protein